MPLELFRTTPFIYSGPDFKFLPCGVISDVMSYRGRQFERFYPMTVSSVEDNHVSDRLFCLGFFYIDSDGGLVLFLTHPCWISSAFESSFLIDFLLTNVEEFTRSLNCRFIEVEFHDELTSKVAFPTSLSHFSYDLGKIRIQEDDLSIMRRHGFEEETALFCYERKISDSEELLTENFHLPSKDYTVTSINQTEFRQIKEKKNPLPIKSYAISDGRPFVISENLPFLPNTAFFAHHESDVVGFVRWFPNLLELLQTGSTPTPLLFPHVLKTYPFHYGKIFEWSLKTEDSELFAILLLHVLKAMKRQGLGICQIGNVQDEDSFVKKFLEQYGFQKVHEVKILRRQVT
ncbi:hypothetical protein KEJ26_04290 [Candidatus Bathyarchaeota archaeon]|nr:hypothetical protein [Candidatus Bathyarchaeota archaeon]